MATNFLEPSIITRPRPKRSLLGHQPSKKRKIEHKIEEINFDTSSREEYLTGFHKRKVARTKQAQAEAAKKAKEERIVIRKQVCYVLPDSRIEGGERRILCRRIWPSFCGMVADLGELQLREERRQELQEHVEAVNALLQDVNGGDSDGEEGWNGFDDDPVEKPPVDILDHEEEYIDEDRYTTVTVEAVDVDKEGLHKAVDEDEDSDAERELKKKYKSEEGKEDDGKKKWPKKPRKQKFRYESKVERKMTRAKQKAGKRKAADARKGE